MLTPILLVFFAPIRSLALMKFPRSTILFILLASTVSGPVIAESELTLFADTPTARVNPRAAERSPLALPELEYNFRVKARCHDDLEATSLLLAVADTRQTFNRSQIASGELDAVNLRIPSSQIAPLVIANFCVAPDAETDKVNSQLRLLIRSALSAHASLLCVSEGNQSMKYASARLDVELHCISDIESGTSVRQ
jgi:hypothetical protein